MTIGINWAEGSYADTSWASSAWQSVVIEFNAILKRIHIVAKELRVHIIGG